MRRWTLAVSLALLGAVVLAGESDIRSALDDLFDRDPAVRERARAEVRAAGDEALPKVLERIEAHLSSTGRADEVLELHDVSDFQKNARAWSEILARLKGAAGEAADIREQGGVLVIRAPRDTMRTVRGILHAIREGTDRYVVVKARLLRTAQRGDPAVVWAPDLCCPNGQRAEIRKGKSVAAVRDCKATPGPDRGLLVETIVEDAQDGVRLAVRPVVAPGTSRITLFLDLTVSRVTEPESPRAEEPAPGGVAGLQVPEVRTTSLRRAVTLEKGKTARIRAGVDPSGGALVLELSAHAVAPGFLADLGVETK